MQWINFVDFTLDLGLNQYLPLSLTTWTTQAWLLEMIDDYIDVES